MPTLTPTSSTRMPQPVRSLIKRYRCSRIKWIPCIRPSRWPRLSLWWSASYRYSCMCFGWASCARYCPRRWSAGSRPVRLSTWSLLKWRSYWVSRSITTMGCSRSCLPTTILETGYETSISLRSPCPSSPLSCCYPTICT